MFDQSEYTVDITELYMKRNFGTVQEWMEGTLSGTTIDIFPKLARDHNIDATVSLLIIFDVICNAVLKFLRCDWLSHYQYIMEAL
ncbi:MAG: hypothetical protein EPN93_07310 [Spirochaetes bacterium]|nr:MAG: hypothetical protein EPN93_07310 [Spirochaetota bacterium]